MGSSSPTSLTLLEQDFLAQVCVREIQREQFSVQNFYRIEVTLKSGRAGSFSLPLCRIKTDSKLLLSEEVAKAVILDLKEQRFSLQSFDVVDSAHPPAWPVTEAELVLSAAMQWDWPASSSRKIIRELKAQSNPLVEQGVSPEKIETARMAILGDYGVDYLPARARRLSASLSPKLPLIPASVRQTPRKIRRQLTPEQQALYQLIWARFVAWQMADARLQKIKVEVTAGENKRYHFERQDVGVLFRGYMQVHEQEGDADLCRESTLWPVPLHKRELLRLHQFALINDSTTPPQHLHPVDFFKGRAMEREASQNALLSLLAYRYLQRNDRGLEPTDRGMRYYLENLIREQPAPPTPASAESIHRLANPPSDTARRQTCPECGRPLVARQGRYGRFLACTGYPKCRHTEAFPVDIPCPEAGCRGHLVERHTPKGQLFYGCSEYPHCNHLQWQVPSN